MKDVILYDGNSLIIAVFFILFKMLCIYYVQTYIFMYIIIFSLSFYAK